MDKRPAIDRVKLFQETRDSLKEGKVRFAPVLRSRRGNRFCGPAILSIILGCDTDEASRALRRVTGRRQITGVPSWALLEVLYRNGLAAIVRQDFSELEAGKRPTLTAWLRSTKKQRTAGKVWLLLAGNHFGLVSGRRWVCGQTTEIVSVRHKKVGRRRRVKTAWELKPRLNALAK